MYRPIDVGVAETWDPGFGEFMRNSYHYHPKILDHDSAVPLALVFANKALTTGNE